MEKINDILGYKNLKIYQDSQYFSFSLDSVFLANYSTIRLKDKNIVDFCTGNAVIPLILSKRCNRIIDAVEIQNNVFALAKKSVEYNNLGNRINLYNMNVIDFSNVNDNINKYDLVLCNPPFFKNIESSIKNISYEKAVARHEILINLDQVCYCANKVLKEKGNFCIVHRTERLLNIFDSFRKYNIEPKRVKFIYESIDKQSSIVLIEGQKGGNPGLFIDRPLVMYNSDGSISDEYKRMQEEVIR